MQLTPVAHQVLDTIASGESHGYTDLYGGRKFHSFAEHPGVQVALADGQVTTAAGRYQMVKPTWEAQKKKLGLPDFSPASQDLAAWDLAQHTYKQQTGRDLSEDQAKGAVNWGALSNQWTSLKPQATAKAAAAGPQATQPLVAPISAPYLRPVDSNPLAISGSPDLPLTPVQHDPFQTQASAWLRPVAHDPFQPKDPSP